MANKKTNPLVKAPPATPPVVWNGTALEGLSKSATHSQNMAALATRPSVAAAFTVKAYAGIAKDTDEYDIIEELQKAGNEVRRIGCHLDICGNSDLRCLQKEPARRF